MMTKYIRVIGKRIPLSAYTTGVKLAKANLDGQFTKTLTSEFGGTGQDIVTEFRRGLHDRINRHLPEGGTRDFTSAAVWRFKVMLNSRAIIREHDIPRCLQRYRKHFEHRIYSQDDF